jgi:hypothetical protein
MPETVTDLIAQTLGAHCLITEEWRVQTDSETHHQWIEHPCSCKEWQGDDDEHRTHQAQAVTEALGLVERDVIQAQIDVLRGAATGIEDGLRLGYSQHPDVAPWTRGVAAAVAAIRKTADRIEGGDR